MKKKLVSLLVVMLMLVMLVPTTALAEETVMETTGGPPPPPPPTPTITLNVVTKDVAGNVIPEVGGTATPSDSTYPSHGTEYPCWKITATPKDGFRFVEWGGQGLIENKANNPNYAWKDRSRTFTAYFQMQPALTIEVPTGGGSVTADPTGTTFNPGTKVTLKAIPADSSWEFDHWEGTDNNSSSVNSHVFMNDNRTVKAYFKQKQMFTLTTQVPTGGGTISTNPSGTSFEKDTKVYVTATNEPGWLFDHWEGAEQHGDQKWHVHMDAAKTVKAYFIRITYNITFKVGAHGKWTDNNGSADRTAGVESGTTPTAPGITANTGYEHTGWEPTLEAATGPKTYTATYKPLTYNITYTLNDGTASGNPDTYTIETSTFQLNNPTKQGYEFVGWSSPDFQGTKKTVTIPKGTTGHKSYTAEWKEIKYTVKFNSNHGTPDYADQTVLENGKATNPGSPERSGFAFDGWWYKSGHQNGHDVYSRWDFDTNLVTKNITLYANWIETHKVTFDPDNGESIPDQNVKNGEKVIKPTDPVKPGYEFKGWWFKVCGQNYQWDFNTQVYCDVALKAKWKAIDYTVTYNSNNATSGSVPTDSNIYHITNTVTVKENSGNLQRTGFTFEGWNTAADGSGISYLSSATFAMGDANVILYAKWRAIDRSVTYNGNGATSGAAPIDSTAYHYTDIVKVAGNTGSLAMAGYSFIGWNTTADGSGTPYAADASLTIGETDVILYAQWKINSYEVKFFQQDGTTQIGTTQKIDWNKSATLETAPAITGFAFDKWVLTGDSATEADSLTNVKENLKAVASYIKNGYTVTFLDYRSQVIGTCGVLHGGAATAPAVPARDGYKFTGWDKAFTNVTGNLTVTAQYAINTYTVKFVDFDGKVLSTQTVNWNTAATAPANPTRTGYKFTSWDKAFANVTSDLTITAQYTKNATVVDSEDENIPKTYDDGTEVTLQDESVPVGQIFGIAWWWIAAAAVVLGAFAWFIIYLVRRGKKSDEIV